MTVETAGPALVMRGLFSIYENPDGGVVVAYRLEGQDEDSHVPIPAFIAQMAREAAESGRVPGPMSLIGAAKRTRARKAA